MQAPRYNNHLMNYVALPNAFSPEECERIIHLRGVPQHAMISTIAENRSLINTQKRKTLTKSLDDSPENQWLLDRIWSLIQRVNAQTFQLQLSDLEILQVLEYRHSGFYEPHTDMGSGNFSRRKLSLITFLSPPEAYQGGALTFFPETFSEPVRTQGTAVFFPAYLLHQVHPVTAGCRHSLVAWAQGPCLK